MITKTGRTVLVNHWNQK